MHLALRQNKIVVEFDRELVLLEVLLLGRLALLIVLPQNGFEAAPSEVGRQRMAVIHEQSLGREMEQSLFLGVTWPRRGVKRAESGGVGDSVTWGSAHGDLARESQLQHFLTAVGADVGVAVNGPGDTSFGIAGPEEAVDDPQADGEEHDDHEAAAGLRTSEAGAPAERAAATKAHHDGGGPSNAALVSAPA